jgi:predicted DNA-binding helix-hairpin-helix protein
VTADLLERADLLSGDAQFDLCAREGRPSPDGDVSGARATRPERRYRHGDLRRHVAIVQHPKGPMPVLRTMTTNACAKDCFYCPFRAGRSFRREAVTPDELALLTDQLYRARVIQGLFLSSGVVGHGDHSMDRIVATAELLRRRYDFRGYLHLKIMPGASDDAIAGAIALADRVSVNLEAPTTAHLARLTTTKDLAGDLIAPLRRAQALAAAAGRRVSRTTQFVVGAAGESDQDILGTTARLYREVGLSRAYFSAFRPVPDTPLDGLPPEDPLRQHRLYQADFLLRQYRFTLDDLVFEGKGDLAQGVDPKLAWARRHPEAFPVEVNRASRAALLRVPGFGPKSVDALLAARRAGRVRDVSTLAHLGASARRALPWITIDGRTPPRQLELPVGDGVSPGA